MVQQGQGKSQIHRVIAKITSYQDQAKKTVHFPLRSLNTILLDGPHALYNIHTRDFLLVQEQTPYS